MVEEEEKMLCTKAVFVRTGTGTDKMHAARDELPLFGCCCSSSSSFLPSVCFLVRFYFHFPFHPLLPPHLLLLPTQTERLAYAAETESAEQLVDAQAAEQAVDDAAETETVE